MLLTANSRGGFASGAGNLTVPLMALTVPVPQAAGIALPLPCATDLSGLRAWRGRWSVREMRVLVPGGLLGIGLGALAFDLLPDRAILGLVGVMTLAFLARTAWVARRRESPPPAAPNAAKGTVCAALSGLTSTIAHAGGPPLAVYLYPLRLDRRTLAAATVLFFALVNYAKLVPYFPLGQLSPRNLLTALVLPLALLGVHLGVWLQRRVPDAAFYRLLYVLLFATGVKLT